ncbi:MAG: hypothetical protein AAF581_15280 [Planctomycetota bacterium]
MTVTNAVDVATVPLKPGEDPGLFRTFAFEITIPSPAHNTTTAVAIVPSVPGVNGFVVTHMEFNDVFLVEDGAGNVRWRGEGRALIPGIRFAPGDSIVGRVAGQPVSPPTTTICGNIMGYEY